MIPQKHENNCIWCTRVSVLVIKKFCIFQSLDRNVQGQFLYNKLNTIVILFILGSTDKTKLFQITPLFEKKMCSALAPM